MAKQATHATESFDRSIEGPGDFHRSGGGGGGRPGRDYGAVAQALADYLKLRTEYLAAEGARMWNAPPRRFCEIAGIDEYSTNLNSFVAMTQKGLDSHPVDGKYVVLHLKNTTGPQKPGSSTPAYQETPQTRIYWELVDSASRQARKANRKPRTKTVVSTDPTTGAGGQ